MGNANILRGKKWSDVKDKAIFEKDSKTIEWLDSQKAIVDNIEEYKISINKPTDKPKKADKGA